MAATAPVLLYPSGGETGVRLGGRLIVYKDDYSGAGTQREWQIQVGNGGFTAAQIALGYDSLLVENDDHLLTDDTYELHPELWNGGKGAQSGVTYSFRCRVRNTSDETSSWSATVTATFETARLTLADWQRAQ